MLFALCLGSMLVVFLKTGSFRRLYMVTLSDTLSSLITHRHEGEYLNFVSLQEVDLILGSLVPGRAARFPLFFWDELDSHVK